MTDITQTIDALPTAPDPDTMTREQYAAAAAAMVVAIKAMVLQLQTWSGQVNTVKGEMNTAVSATAADALSTAADALATATDRVQTGLDVISAAASAATAASYGASLSGTSATSVAMATGAKSFTATTGRQWDTGQFLNIASSGTPADYMLVQVTSYNDGSGALVVNSLYASSGATHSDWSITLSGPKGEPGLTGPSGLTSWIRKTSAYTAAANERISASTTGGGWSLTFPPNPTDGDECELRDVNGTFNTNNLTALVNAANGNASIMGYTTSWVINTRYFHGRFVYDATTNNWGI